MKLLALLFLCSRLLPSLTQESSQEIDCDDEDLFKAVDTALKKYNSRSQSGNQFVLYRVTEVVRTVSELCFTLRPFEMCAVLPSPDPPPIPPAHTPTIATPTITQEPRSKGRSLHLLEKINTTLWSQG